MKNFKCIFCRLLNDDDTLIQNGYFFKACYADCVKPLTDATLPAGTIHPLRKTTMTFQPLMPL